MQCLYCTLPLRGHDRWCSKQCFECWRAETPTEVQHCPRCDRDFLAPVTYTRRRIYCSRTCYAAHFNQSRTGARNGRWRGGRALSYGPGWKPIRALVRARDRVCRACGKTPEENGRALDVHHLEPYRFSGTNELDDLVALCRSCHARADDHGRAGSAEFLRRAGKPPRPTKRQIRRLRARVRQAQRIAKRRELRREANRLRAEGESLREIARALGVSHQTVANWLGGTDAVGERAIPYLAHKPRNAHRARHTPKPGTRRGRRARPAILQRISAR